MYINCDTAVCFVALEGKPKLAQLAPIPLTTSQCKQLAAYLGFSVSLTIYELLQRVFSILQNVFLITHVFTRALK